VADIVPYDPRALTVPRDPFPPRVPEGYPEPQSASLGLKDYIAIVRRQLLLVLTIMAVVLGIASYLILSAPPRYKALPW
jgi:Uncharacterized protein involved in exopolysaccharide biosynthesis